MKQLTIIGNVGRDPEIRTTHDGTSFATFSVGIHIGKNTDGTKKTDWVDVSVNNSKTIEIVKEYVRRGAKIMVQGHPTARAYMSKSNEPAASLQLYANTIELLTPKSENDPVYNTLPDESSQPARIEGALPEGDIPY